MLIRTRDLRSLRMVARDGRRQAVFDLLAAGEGLRVSQVARRHNQALACCGLA